MVVLGPRTAYLYQTKLTSLTELAYLLLKPRASVSRFMDCMRAAWIVVWCQNLLKLSCQILIITLSMRNKAMNPTFMRRKRDRWKSFTKCKLGVKIVELSLRYVLSIKLLDARKSFTTRDLIIKFPAGPCKNCVFLYNVCSEHFLLR